MSTKMWLQLAVVMLALSMVLVMVGCHGSPQWFDDTGDGNGDGNGEDNGDDNGDGNGDDNGDGNGDGNGDDNGDDNGDAPGLFSAYVAGASWVYRETLDDGSQQNLTFTVSGTRDINGTECAELRINQVGGILGFAYFTVSEANGGFFHALADGAGNLGRLPDDPAQMLPGNPPADFTTESSLFPLNGTYAGTTVSTEATVTVPAGTYNNAWQVQLSCDNPGFNGPRLMTIWIVPGVGMVRILLDYGDGVTIDVSMVSHTPG